MTDQEIIDQLGTWNMTNRSLFFALRNAGYSIQDSYKSLFDIGDKVATQQGVPAHESPKRLRRRDD